jgi:hypothetical protein
MEETLSFPHLRERGKLLKRNERNPMVANMKTSEKIQYDRYLQGEKLPHF